jgi:hypothetical protein
VADSGNSALRLINLTSGQTNTVLINEASEGSISALISTHQGLYFSGNGYISYFNFSDNQVETLSSTDIGYVGGIANVLSSQLIATIPENAAIIKIWY